MTTPMPSMINPRLRQERFFFSPMKYPINSGALKTISKIPKMIMSLSLPFAYNKVPLSCLRRLLSMEREVSRTTALYWRIKNRPNSIDKNKYTTFCANLQAQFS